VVRIVKSRLKIASSLTATAVLACLLAMSPVHTAHAREWNLKDKDGMQYTLSSLRGKWVLVNFWAPWCPECIREIPEFNALHEQRKDLQVIGVAVMYDNRKQVLDKIAKYSIAFPTVFGNEDTAGDFDGLDGVPTSFLYTPSGQLVGHHQGPLTRSEIEQIITQNDAGSLFSLKR
jgi:thiol-disulfide isomerase/thioredoxin